MYFAPLNRSPLVPRSNTGFDNLLAVFRVKMTLFLKFTFHMTVKSPIKSVLEIKEIGSASQKLGNYVKNAFFLILFYPE